MDSILTDSLIRSQYEKYFFKNICGIMIDDRDSYSIRLNHKREMYFSCVQDTVKRLTELTGRTSLKQWRNCIFVPISQGLSLTNKYEEVFEDLLTSFPSLFIRSYVYVVYIILPDSQKMDFWPNLAIHPKKEDFRIRLWNSEGNIANPGKTNPFNLAGDYSEQVFVINDPEAELKRIQDANSDVIDAVKAYMGELQLIDETEGIIQDIKNRVEESASTHILVQGPARSGKTIIAMSLLGKCQHAMMLLMNWHFYSALKDAFMVWAKMPKGEIENMFKSSSAVLNASANYNSFLRFNEDPKLLEVEQKMRTLNSSCSLEKYPHWKKYDTKEKRDWHLTKIVHSSEGDYVFAVKKQKDSDTNKELKVVRITEVFPEKGEARCADVYSENENCTHTRIISPDKSYEAANKVAKENLDKFQKAIENNTVEALQAEIIKDISNAFEASGQKFFHHDFNQKDSIKIQDIKYLGEMNNSLLIVDEAQRLGPVGEVDKPLEIANFPGNVLLLGDDNQMLNQKYDKGIKNIQRLSTEKFEEITLLESIGLPDEILKTILAFLGEEEQPTTIETSFQIKLILNDDITLINAFNQDPAQKKHYAIPAGTNFYSNGYYPGLFKSSEATPNCDSKCTQFCSHRFISMISNKSYPKNSIINLTRNVDLSETYKFFCAEQIMPNYALSAYELISREVESLYLKIPAEITEDILEFPIGNDDIAEAWIKRHLYVLMTRATNRLVINIESKGLYCHFKKVCEKTGINTNL